MSQAFNIIIYRGISALCHGREVLDGLNATDKQYIFQLMNIVKIPIIQRFDTKISLNTSTQTYGASLAQ